MRLSEIMRLELQPLGVRVVTAMVGSVNTPLFSKPGAINDLPDTSYYYRIPDKLHPQRVQQQNDAIKVEPFAQQFVADLLDTNKATVWRGSAAALVRFATWAFPQWYLEKVCNDGRGLELVKRPGK